MTLDDIKGRTYTSSEEFWRDLERAVADERTACGIELWNALVDVSDEVRAGTLEAREGGEVGMSVAGSLAKKWMGEE